MMQNLIAALEKDIGDTCSYIYIYIHRERERYIYIYIYRERERERGREGGRERERGLFYCTNHGLNKITSPHVSGQPCSFPALGQCTLSFPPLYSPTMLA
jgi:hypothetical protein